ncbi:MAG: hypothetical protein EXR99_12970 [Gemmataceae bacterium]|nr:hypothetical protein [Gemmataceae bacterium]
MLRQVIPWMWIPRYYRKVERKPDEIRVVYWYFGLETVFILALALVIYFTTIRDGIQKKESRTNQVEVLRQSMGDPANPPPPAPPSTIP